MHNLVAFIAGILDFGRESGFLVAGVGAVIAGGILWRVIASRTKKK